ncbi:uncharacterized protein [Lolium perenne]|uniref:uncharacterized protein n=1 Tax=Lolium perenne TaxID=4522 RepID=UPI0021E9F7EB|nr:uncharacterized protein LOC127298483 [Lolium perenne]
MPSATSPSGRAGRRWCARGDLLTLAVAAMLCSATYCFSIWHNGRNAPDKIVIIGQASFVAAGAARCVGDADTVELDFEAHHTAERAGLSVSSSTAAPATVAGRRALRSAAEPVDTVHHGAVNGDGWARLDGGKLRFTYDGAVRV